MSQRWQEVVTITVPCIPVGQPRVQATMRGKRAGVFTPDRIKNRRTGVSREHPIVPFKAALKVHAKAAYQGPLLDGVLRVDWRAAFPRPSSKRWKTKPMPREMHAVKPDKDNVEKAIFDAMSGVLWVDDSRIAAGYTEKVICAGDEQPHVTITIYKWMPNYEIDS